MIDPSILMVVGGVGMGLAGMQMSQRQARRQRSPVDELQPSFGRALAVIFAVEDPIDAPIAALLDRLDQSTGGYDAQDPA